MRVREKAVVLHAVRHGDKKQIVKLYSRGHGLLSVIATPGKSPSSKLRAAHLLPLSMIDAEVVSRENRELQRLTEASPFYICDRLSASVGKLTVAQFINEVLLRSLREQQPSPELFDFVVETLVCLNESENGFHNLHIVFLLRLSRHLGFEPLNDYSKTTPFFDCREGRFTPVSLSYPLGLGGEESRLFSRMLDQDVLSWKISRAERLSLLDGLLACYRMHVPGFSELRSLPVLKEVLEG